MSIRFINFKEFKEFSFVRGWLIGNKRRWKIVPPKKLENKRCMVFSGKNVTVAYVKRPNCDEELEMYMLGFHDAGNAEMFLMNIDQALKDNPKTSAEKVLLDFGFDYVEKAGILTGIPSHLISYYEGIDVAVNPFKLEIGTLLYCWRTDEYLRVKDLSKLDVGVGVESDPRPGQTTMGSIQKFVLLFEVIRCCIVKGKVE